MMGNELPGAIGKSIDVICMGRAAVDFYGEQLGSRLEDMRSMAKFLGGSSANMAVGMSRQGLSVAMLARVGDEHMGRFVREELARNGVDVQQVHTDTNRLTGLVLLGIKDRDTFPLIFYRENCADMAITEDDVDEDFIAAARALAITGTHFSTHGTHAACRKAMGFARSSNTRLVLDIDYRPVLWGVAGHGEGEDRFVSSAQVSEHLQSIIPEFDLIVGTEEEIHIAGGTTDTLQALRNVRDLSSATIVLKRGPLGCVVFPDGIPDTIEDGISTPGVSVEVLNVLGAGDAFISGFMRGWVAQESLENCCRYANACGALVVSRLGCAPAIPTREELDDYLSRSSSVPRPDLDDRLNHLHRVTAPRRSWPDIYALAFDHRSQFEDMVAEFDADHSKIFQLKSLISQALQKVTEDEGLTGHAGMLVDGRFGSQVLERNTGKGLWIARPVELPQSRPLQFEMGNNLSAELRTWPSEHIVKCLVFYHPDDEPNMKAQQNRRLLDLFEACQGSGHELLLEVILPGGFPEEGGTMVRAMEEIYNLGIFPDWWKLPSPKAQEWPAIEALIERFDQHCHGVVLLGLDRPAAELVEGFRAASGQKYCKGFAIGRSIFAEPARRWLQCSINDEQLISNVASNFSALIHQWRAQQSESPQQVLEGADS
jgi:5-dehydro-2-deoxygluconokinase